MSSGPIHVTAQCPLFAPFFGYMGSAFAMIFCALGAAYGTAKSGVGIAGMGTFHPNLIFKSLIPVVMAGILTIYGLVVAVLISGSINPQSYSLFSGALQLAAGLIVGLAALAAGGAIGVAGDALVRGFAQEQRMFVGMVLILIFAEVLALYGLIVALIMNNKAASSECPS